MIILYTIEFLHTHTHTDCDINGRAFSEAGGHVCLTDMIHMTSYRRMALRLMTQLILLEGK